MTAQQVQNTFLELAKTQGLPFILLCIAVYWFNDKVERLEVKQESCNKELMEYYEKDHLEMVKAIDRNTKAINKVLNDNK